MRRPATAVPVIRYRDPAAAARWLRDAFGFEIGQTVTDADAAIGYIAVELGGGVALICPAAGTSPLDGLMAQPEDLGGANTQICYLSVEDVPAHRNRAALAGAQIDIEPEDDGNGGSYYSCRDPEGHVWSFGSSAFGRNAGKAEGAASPSRSSFRGALLGAAVMAIVATGGLGYLAGVAGHFQPVASGTLATPEARAVESSAVTANVANREALLQTTQKQLALLQSDLTGAQADKVASEHALADLKAKAEQLRLERDRTETEKTALRVELDRNSQENRTAISNLKSDLQSNATLKAEMLQLRQDQQASADAATAKLADTQKQLANAEAARISAAHASAELKVSLEHLQSSNRQAEAEMAAVQSERAKLSQGLSGARADLSAERAKAQTLTNQLAELHQANQAAENGAATSNGLLADERQKNMALRGKVDELNKSLADALETRTALQRALDTANNELKSQTQDGVFVSGQMGTVTVTPDPAPGDQIASLLKKTDNAPPVPSAAARPPLVVPQAARRAVPQAKAVTPCVAALGSQLAMAGQTGFNPAGLCSGAENSLEPVKCFSNVVHGAVNWGGGVVWTAGNAALLCAGTHNASRTLSCFEAKTSAGVPWRKAIGSCGFH